MHLPPSLDTSILTSPLYRRYSSHRNLTTTTPTTGHDVSTTSTANTSNDIPSPMPTGAIMLKSSPSPMFRGRSPPKYLNRHPVSKRRWRAIGRVVVVMLVVFVLAWMGREGVRCRDTNSYTCLPSRPQWLTTPSIPSTSSLRDSTTDWVGGGSVIGHLIGQIPPAAPEVGTEQGVLSGMVQDEEGNMQLVEVPETVQGRDEQEVGEVWGDGNEDEEEFIGGMDIPGF